MIDESNIIEFDFKITDRRLGTKNQRSKEYSCKHRHVLADANNKVLECARCGFIYTPWEYVYRLAKGEERIYSHLHYAKQEQKRLDAELTDLKRKIKNAKSQLKRAKNAS